jgi:hypothetical protein
MSGTNQQQVTGGPPNSKQCITHLCQQQCPNTLDMCEARSQWYGSLTC